MSQKLFHVSSDFSDAFLTGRIAIVFDDPELSKVEIVNQLLLQEAKKLHGIHDFPADHKIVADRVSGEPRCREWVYQIRLVKL